MARKPRPTMIYREEFFSPNPLSNWTRQTFDQKQYDLWRSGEPSPFGESRFYVGEIRWQPDGVVLTQEVEGATRDRSTRNLKESDHA